jgi:poly(A) polymerase
MRLETNRYIVIMNKDIIENIYKLLETLHDEIPQLYLVGGAVRDWLLDKEIKDIDIVCRNAETLAKSIAGLKKMTVVAFEKKADEPCYRVIDRDINEITIDFMEMRGNNINEDLKRRDFTINALAIEIIPGNSAVTIIDPLGGQNDLGKRLIRLCSDHAIKNDPLRMLRAIRFSAELGFTIENDTEVSIGQQAFRLNESAPERVMSEMLRIFAVPRCTSYVRKMDQLCLLDVVFPEIQPMRGCSQSSYHHQDVWNHSINVLEKCESILNNLEKYFGDHSSVVLNCLRKNDRLPLLKIACLFHDVGKPHTRNRKSESARIIFYGHDAKGKDILSEMALRLKISKKSRMLLETLTAEHLHVVNLSKFGVKKSTIIKFFRKLGDNAILSIILSIADTQSKMGPSSNELKKKVYLDWCRKIVAEYVGSLKKQFEEKNLISGKDLMNLGLIPGPDMGKILNQIREAQDSGMFRNKQDALDFAKSIIAGS